MSRRGMVPGKQRDRPPSPAAGPTGLLSFDNRWQRFGPRAKPNSLRARRNPYSAADSWGGTPIGGCCCASAASGNAAAAP
jgi:hypothetical protein